MNFLRILQRILIVVLVGIFLTETTGIALFVHTCNSSNTQKFSLYTKGESCCSGEENMESEGTLINEPACCRDEVRYIRAQFSGFPVFQKQPEVKILDILFEEPSVKITEIPLSEDYMPFADHPPPVPGTSIYIFLHQIRIPFHTC